MFMFIVKLSLLMMIINVHMNDGHMNSRDMFQQSNDMFASSTTSTIKNTATPTTIIYPNNIPYEDLPPTTSIRSERSSNVDIDVTTLRAIRDRLIEEGDKDDPEDQATLQHFNTLLELAATAPPGDERTIMERLDIHSNDDFFQNYNSSSSLNNTIDDRLTRSSSISGRTFGSHTKNGESRYHSSNFHPESINTNGQEYINKERLKDGITTLGDIFNAGTAGMFPEPHPNDEPRSPRKQKLNVKAFQSPKIVQAAYPANSHLRFVKRGTITGSLNYAHLSFRIDLATFIHDVKQICRCPELLNNMVRRDTTDTMRDYVRDERLILHAACASLKHQMDELDHIFNMGVQTPRQKRFVLATIAVVSTLIGVFNSAALFLNSQGDQDLDDLMENQDQIVLALQNHELRLTRLEHEQALLNKTLFMVADMNYQQQRTIDFITVLNLCQHQISATTSFANRLTNAMYSLLSNRLHPGFISSKELSKRLSELDTKIQYMGYSLAIDSIADLFQLETSFAVLNHDHVSSHELIIYVHIPIYRAQSIYNLWEYIPTPFMTPANHSFYFSIDHDKEFLAINHKNSTYMEYSVNQLASCMKIRSHDNLKFYLCDNMNIEYIGKSISSSCLVAAFTNNIPNVDRCCPTVAIPKKAMVQQLDKHEFLYLAPEPILVNMHCMVHTDLGEFSQEIVGLNTIIVPSGCKAVTDLHRFSAIGDLFTNVIVIHQIASWDSSFIDINFTLDDYANIAESLLSSKNSSFRVKDIRHAYGIHRLTVDRIIPSYVLSSAALGIAFLLFIWIFYLWCTRSACCSRSRTHEPLGNNEININLGHSDSDSHSLPPPCAPLDPSANAP